MKIVVSLLTALLFLCGSVPQAKAAEPDAAPNPPAQSAAVNPYSQFDQQPDSWVEQMKISPMPTPPEPEYTDAAEERAVYPLYRQTIETYRTYVKTVDVYNDTLQKLATYCDAYGLAVNEGIVYGHIPWEQVRKIEVGRWPDTEKTLYKIQLTLTLKQWLRWERRGWDAVQRGEADNLQFTEPYVDCVTAVMPLLKPIQEEAEKAEKSLMKSFHATFNFAIGYETLKLEQIRQLQAEAAREQARSQQDTEDFQDHMRALWQRSAPAFEECLLVNDQLLECVP